jgi:hypothetical protein
MKTQIVNLFQLFTANLRNFEQRRPLKSPIKRDFLSLSCCTAAVMSNARLKIDWTSPIENILVNTNIPNRFIKKITNQ